jgi:hypothetical protein
MTRSAVILISLLVSSSHAEDAESLFVRRVWPLFQEKCLACHGNDEKKIKAGYDMRTLKSATQGGESGVKALVPGKPEESPLYLASTRQHADWEPMPPKEADQLKPEQLAWIKEWMTNGAPWPDEAERNVIAKASAGSSTISSRLDASNAVLAAQSAAKGAKRGLWSDPAPVPPWEWRAKAKK